MYIHRTFWENNVLQETFYLWYLVSDLNSGRYINQPGRKCNRLCVGRECCDALATCKCGTHTGKYECLCPAGHYGNGLKGSCQGEFNCHQHTHRNNIEQSTYKQYLYKICSGMNANTFATISVVQILLSIFYVLFSFSMSIRYLQIRRQSRWRAHVCQVPGWEPRHGTWGDLWGAMRLQEGLQKLQQQRMRWYGVVHFQYRFEVESAGYFTS